MSPITSVRSTAFNMSTSVSAAAETAVSASISTPVRPVVRTRHSIPTAAGRGSSANATSTASTRSGWASGIHSAVRLAAITAARCAVASAFPLGPPPARSSRSVADCMRTRPRATASRTVSRLADTSTMRTRPFASRWERGGIGRGA